MHDRVERSVQICMWLSFQGNICTLTAGFLHVSDTERWACVLEGQFVITTRWHYWPQRPDTIVRFCRIMSEGGQLTSYQYRSVWYYCCFWNILKYCPWSDLVKGEHWNYMSSSRQITHTNCCILSEHLYIVDPQMSQKCSQKLILSYKLLDIITMFCFIVYVA